MHVFDDEAELQVCRRAPQGAAAWPAAGRLPAGAGTLA